MVSSIQFIIDGATTSTIQMLAGVWGSSNQPNSRDQPKGMVQWLCEYFKLTALMPPACLKKPDDARTLHVAYDASILRK